jgi:hypothetical protein
MPIDIHVEAPKRKLLIGETDEIEAVYSRAAWRATYRGQNLWSPKLSKLREDAEALFAKQRENMARARRLRDAEKNPVPAVLASTLEPVGVRGVDKRSGYLLIIDPKGERMSVSSARLLRPLSDEERETLLALRKARDAARAAVDEAPQPESAEKIEKVLSLNVPAIYDFETEEIVGTYRDKTYRGATPEAVRQAILADVLLSDRPYSLHAQGALISAEEWIGMGFDPVRYGRERGVFASREDADAYVEAVHRSQEAERALATALGDYSFDASEFEAESV